ncbi:MAG: hypothetical protein RBU27_04100 [Bacteroidota bacterium]|jgi:hypothetical protein|nr:hypothetical protein [Bacteroidota bacterium]
MHRRLFILPIVFLLPLFFTSCGDDDDDAPVGPATPKTVTGIWDVNIGTSQGLWNIKESNGVLSGSFTFQTSVITDLVGTISSSGAFYLESKAEWIKFEGTVDEARKEFEGKCYLEEGWEYYANCTAMKR